MSGGGGVTTAVPAAGFSPATILARLLTVDGTGSGRDADEVRGTTPSTAGLALLALTSIAAGGLILGSGSNTVSALAIGASGTFLKSNGTTAAWTALDASDIGAGTLAVARGGTGLSSYAVGDILYADGAASLAKLAGVATGNALISGGIATAPSWGKIGLTTHVSGILPSANGGTGVNNAGTITNANDTTITGGGTLALGGYTLTVPATGTAALLGSANAFTSTVSVVDGSFSILGSSDATKIAKFEVDGFTTATTRTFTLPNTSDTLAVLGAQTFTGAQTISATGTALSISTSSSNSAISVPSGGVTAARLIAGSAPSGVYAIETNAGTRSDYTSTDVNGRYSLDFRRVANTSASGAHNARSVSGSLYGTISSGQTNSGQWTGLWSEALRNYVATGDTGTLTALEGARITVGHFNTDASTPTTTTIKGLYMPLYRSSGTIATLYGIHIASGSSTITPTTEYGLYIDSLVGTTQYAIYTNSGLIRFGDEVLTAASTTTRAGLNIPHGSAPSSPVNGDMWTTTAGLYVRINGSTIGPLS